MSETALIKLCPICLHENPRRQPLCLNCGMDITMVRPKIQMDQTSEITTETPCEDINYFVNTLEAKDIRDSLILELIENPSIAVQVFDGQTVGRTDSSDVVLSHSIPGLIYISAVHARFNKRRDQWYVNHEGKTNFIKVDGIQYEDDDEVAIYPGSLVVLSKTAFRVKGGGGEC